MATNVAFWGDEMRVSMFLFVGVALTACSTSSLEPLSTRLEAQSTASLWLQQQASQSPLELMYIEAELGARGQVNRGSNYLGKRTRSAYGQALYARNSGGGDVLNCSDFASSAAAQKFFLASGGPFLDPNDLDRDGDGLACEWGARITQIAATRIVPVVQSRPRYYSSQCFVGPRGGTYTITASGNKNYGGC